MRRSEVTENPVAALTGVGRMDRWRLVAWLLTPPAVSCAAGLVCVCWPGILANTLDNLLPGRVTAPARLGLAPPILPDHLYLIGAAVAGSLSMALAAAIPRAAVAIARERQDGTLEALQLTRMSAFSIYWGKLTGALWLPTLMGVAILPVLCLGFSMGGTPLVAILAAWAFAMLCQAAFGVFALTLSAWSRRPRRSLAIGVFALVLLCGWTTVLAASGRSPEFYQEPWADAALILNPIAGIADIVLAPATGPANPSWAVRQNQPVTYAVPNYSIALCGAAVYPALALLLVPIGVAGVRRR